MVMPNRAMLWHHIMMIYLLVSSVTISITFSFFTQGLTLILPFARLELLALGIVLYISAWQSNIKEIVSVTEGKIKVEVGRNVPEKIYELDKAWVNIVLERLWNNLVSQPIIIALSWKTA